jgi:hypothetical protein
VRSERGEQALAMTALNIPYVNLAAGTVQGLVLQPRHIPILHDDLPTRWKGLGDDLRASFQLQPLQVSEREEQVAVVDAPDDESRAAGAELPLAN